ncbi:hypothetical protein ALC152_05080 [Arcobacter sp. 15-2]|uniref:hypothetical protein n=1 Tax=Arcobacter sp. 15-2 TaxID=3374109 RepID=UPI00399D07DB
MKKIILSVVATSLIATSMFAETSKNGNVIKNTLITCDNGADGFETTVSNLNVKDVVVKYNSCNSRGIEVVDTRKAKSVQVQVQVSYFDFSKDFYINTHAIDFEKIGLDNNEGHYEIKNKNGERIGEFERERFYLFDKKSKDSDLYIEDKVYTVSMSEDNKEFTIKRK